MSSSTNRELFIKEWNSIYQSKDSKLIMVGNVESVKVRKEGSQYVLFNKTLTLKQEAPLGAKEKSVFLSFDTNKFNFCNVSNKEVLFHTHKITESFFDKEEGGEDDQIESHTHPILINTAPVCRYHSLMSMYPDEELPQAVGSDILLLLLNIFKILPGVKIGYNSIGAAASVNHLHFHLIYPEEIINESKLPIEHIKVAPWLNSSLNNPKEEINLYTVPVSIGEISHEGTYALVLQPYNPTNTEIEYSELTNSLSFVFGIVINELMELNIPHNILLTDDGQSVYIFIRDFVSAANLYGWLEYSGIIIVRDEAEFGIEEKKIREKKKSLEIAVEVINQLKSNIKAHLSIFS